MTILHLDFESYFDSDYSLSKMDPPSYILDPRFEAIGCAVRFEGEDRSRFIDGPDLPAFFASVDPTTTTTVAFNALFDNCVFAYRYNFVPARMVCTMRMAVAMRGHLLQRHSLAEVGRSLGVGEKGDVLASARGKHRADLVGDPQFWREYQRYACNDNDMSRAIFHMLLDEFPVSERRVMDRVLRCAVVPKFRVDTKLLADHLVDLKQLKAELLIDAGAPTTLDDPDRDDKLEEFAKTLRSNIKFEQVLQDKGVEIEYKPSLTDPNRQIPAFAKTDSFMATLYDHEDIEVQALAAARLGLRSTIEETRSARILGIGQLDWPSYCHGNMPVPLKYAAAHTHRLGGDWSVNMQNLPSGRGGRLSKLRKSLCAPPGHKVVVADLAQIECVAEGQLVLTEQGPKAIQNVQLTDKVWDGQEFVSHEGVIFKGVQKVISYQGLTATPEHVVYPAGCSDEAGVPLQVAATLGLDIQARPCPHAVRQASMRLPLLSRLQDLWGAWRGIPVRERESFHAVGLGELAASYLRWGGGRSDRQRRALRARQSAALNTAEECQQSVYDLLGAYPAWVGGPGRLHSAAPGVWVWPGSNPASSQARDDRRADHPAVQDQLLEARVYDIVNAGPRHRFMASGVIVSNCRICAYICGQENLLQAFRDKADPYAQLAERIFGYPVDKNVEKVERFIGKTGVLGLGYGCGVNRFYAMVISSARSLGMTLPPEMWSESLAGRAVTTYRRYNAKIAQRWKWLDGIIGSVWMTGTPNAVRFAPVVIGRGYIEGPGGLRMHYHQPRFDMDTQEYVFNYGPRTYKMYGAKMLENIVQFLARIKVMNDALRISDRGFNFVSQSHDELAWIVPDSQVDECMAVALEEMRRPPSWAEGLPLDAECSFGQNYGEAKT